MRVRNLIAKPSTFNGNPLLKKRWETVYKDGDGCGFVVNNGTNTKTDGSDIKTGFDILANSDIEVNRSEEKSAWITALPGCTLCFMLNVTALVEMTAAIAVSYQSNNYWRTMNSTRQMNASQSETLAGMVQHVAGQRNACRLTAVNSVDSNTDIMRVSDITIVTEEEKTIMDYLGVGAFSALTAPYAPSAGGGVFLLALVILSGGWSHENREPIRRSELREKTHHVGSFRSWHGGDSLAGRPALEIRIGVSRHGDHSESAGRRGMRRLEPPAGVFVEEPQYGVTCRLDRRRFGRGEHQRSQQSLVRFPLHGKCGRDGGGTVLLHARGMVVHPDGGRDHLHRRHRTLLNGLGVAA